MTDRQDLISQEDLFSKAREQITQDKKNYLGDRTTVESMLRFYVSSFLEKMQESDTPKQQLNEIKILAREVGGILLGKEGRKFIRVRKWNSSGRIDAFCAKWLGLLEIDPSDRMEHAVIMLFNDILDVVNFAGQDGALEEQWRPAFDGVIEKYTDLFMGVDPVTKMAVDIE